MYFFSRISKLSSYSNAKIWYFSKQKIQINYLSEYYRKTLFTDKPTEIEPIKMFSSLFSTTLFLLIWKWFFFIQRCLLVHHMHQCVRIINQNQNKVCCCLKSKTQIWTWKLTRNTHMKLVTIKRELDPARMRNCLYQNFQQHSNWRDCATKTVQNNKIFQPNNMHFQE